MSFNFTDDIEKRLTAIRSNADDIPFLVSLISRHQACVPTLLDWVDIIQADKSNPAVLMLGHEKGAYILLREMYPKGK